MNRKPDFVFDIETISSVFSSSIYVLYDGDEVVYVGQSKNGLSRVADHTFISVEDALLGYEGKAKRFDRCELYRVGRYDLNNAEARLIVKYNPKYNKSIPKNDLYYRTTHRRAKREGGEIVFENDKSVWIKMSGNG